MYRLPGRSHARFGRIGAVAGGVLLALALAPAAPAALLAERTASPQSVPVTPAVGSTDALESELLEAVNDIRAGYGMRPLRRSRALAAAADHHSRSMARGGFFSHASADGSPFHMRVERFYRRPRVWRIYLVGENILQGEPDVGAADVVRGWLTSPGHRRNLLGDWREVGFGAVRAQRAPGIFGGRSVVIVTANFGTRG